MKNKTLGVWVLTLGVLVLIAIGAAFLAALVETTDYPLAELLYTLSGFGMLIFGTWAGIRLINLDNKK